MTNEDLKQIAGLLQPMQNQMGEMQKQLDHLTQEVVKTNLTIETEIKPQINLLAEGQGALLAKLAPRSEVETLKEKVEFLEAIVRSNTREIAELKKAQ